jgi:eukaryotic-like serine/threonine-protein kinase
MLAGRYRVERRLGGGGMGTVWLARDTRLQRPVAVKLASRDEGGLDGTGAAETARRRLRREAAAISGLSDQRIARVYDYLEADEGAFIVMEYVDGESLAARLARDGALPAAEALEIAAQCAEALEAAHRVGIVHRDVKPSNIMLAVRGGVKMVDFGIAARTHAGGTLVAETAAQGLAGTAAYISPECATGAPACPAADFYALGVVLYQMLAGHLPFSATDPIAMLYAHVVTPPPPLPAQVPAAVADLCLRMLAKDPGDRLCGAAHLSAHLGPADRAADETARDERLWFPQDQTEAMPPVARQASTDGRFGGARPWARLSRRAAGRRLIPIQSADPWQGSRRSTV